jgi:hypothetical protein
VSKIDHHSNKTVTKGMDLGTLFSDAGACMLMPSVDQGPLCTLRAKLHEASCLTAWQMSKEKKSERILPAGRGASS